MIDWFLETEEGEWGEIDRAQAICYSTLCIHWLNLTCPLMRIKPATLTYRDDALTNWATQPGWAELLLEEPPKAHTLWKELRPMAANEWHLLTIFCGLQGRKNTIATTRVKTLRKLEGFNSTAMAGGSQEASLTDLSLSSQLQVSKGYFLWYSVTNYQK